MLSVNTSLSAIIAQTALRSSERNYASALQKIATGNRINSSADDAAGTVIASKFKTQIMSLRQAIKNANDGISITQTMDGGMQGIQSMLQRMRELVVQANNGTFSTSDVNLISNEVNQLKEQIQKLSNTTNWNGISLLNESDSVIKIQMGSNQENKLEISKYDLSKLFDKPVVTQPPSTFDLISKSVAGLTPQDLAVGDLNNDGNLDVIATNFQNSTNNGFVAIGNGDGSFTEKEFLISSSNHITWSSAIGDVNNNGILDVFLTDGQNIYQFSNDGKANFSLKRTIAIATGAADISVIDVNGDKAPDIITTSLSDNKIAVLLNDRNGGFSSPIYSSGSVTNGGYITFKIADLNGDKKLDLVMTNATDNAVSIFNGNADGNFYQQSTYSVPGYPSAIAIGDLNSDGIKDLAIGDFNANKISILIGNGDGTFKNPVDYQSAPNPYMMDITDFNGDGINDLLVSSCQNSSVAIFHGNADGTLANATLYQSAKIPAYVSIGDFNNDGKPDFVTGTSDTKNLNTLLNTTKYPTKSLYPSLAEIDNALEIVDAARSKFGSIQNALMFAIDNLTTTDINLNSSLGRIMDTEYGDASSQLARAQIMNSASTAMIAQSNQQTQMVSILIKQFM